VELPAGWGARNTIACGNKANRGFKSEKKWANREATDLEPDAEMQPFSGTYDPRFESDSGAFNSGLSFAKLNRIQEVKAKAVQSCRHFSRKLIDVIDSRSQGILCQKMRNLCRNSREKILEALPDRAGERGFKRPPSLPETLGFHFQDERKPCSKLAAAWKAIFAPRSHKRASKPTDSSNFVSDFFD
jgi:hypothetical protein